MDWQSVAVSLIVGPAPGALSSYLTNWLIERQKAKRARETQEKQDALQIGVASHMAQVAFDKHVSFCEEYISEVSKVLHVSTRQEERSDLLATVELTGIRQKWAIWLSSELDADLRGLEQALLSPGAWTFDPAGERLSIAGRVRSLVERLRRVLKTEELTRLRDDLMARSLTSDDDRT